MKKLWVFLAIFIGGVVLCCGGTFVALNSAVKSMQANQEAAGQKATEYVSIFLKDYKADSYLAHATPDTPQSREQIQATLSGIKKNFGALQTVENVTTGFNSRAESTTVSGTRLTMSIKLKGEFEKGNAIIRVRMTKADNVWKVASMNVDPVRSDSESAKGSDGKPATTDGKKTEAKK